MVTETFLKEGNTQRELGAVMKSNEDWKFWIVRIIVFNNVGFATLAFVIYRIFKHLEMKRAKNSDELWGRLGRRCNDNWQYIDWKTDGIEFRTTESETD